MQTPKNVLSKTDHRKGAAVTGRAPAGCRAMHFFSKRGPVECRLHPVGTRSGPVRLVEGRLASSNFKYLPDIVRAPLEM